MLSTLQALQKWDKDKYGFVARAGEFEVRLEPLLFDKQWYLAVYKGQSLIAPKIVVRIGKEDE